jgi:hypothetical protein
LSSPVYAEELKTGHGGSSAPSLDERTGTRPETSRGGAHDPPHRATERAIHLFCFVALDDKMAA